MKRTLLMLAAAGAVVTTLRSSSRPLDAQALNSPTFGVNPDSTIDKLAPLFLAAAISIRLTKALIEIFDLDKRRALRWFER